MPIIRQADRGNPVATWRRHLTDLLLKELLGERTRRGPVVFEDPAEPGKVDVTVIWEAFGDVPAGDRASIIRDAYAAYAQTLGSSIHYLDPAKRLDELLVPEVQMAVGATAEEVVRDNLLPFEVRREGNDPCGLDEDELATAMIEAGGLPTARGVRLLFPNDQMAAEASSRLQAQFPGLRWEVVELPDDLHAR